MTNNVGNDKDDGLNGDSPITNLLGRISEQSDGRRN